VHNTAGSITWFVKLQCVTNSTRRIRQQTIEHTQQLSSRPRRAALAAVHGVIDVWRFVHRRLVRQLRLLLLMLLLLRHAVVHLIQPILSQEVVTCSSMAQTSTERR
jgi:hypothetical protein